MRWVLNRKAWMSWAAGGLLVIGAGCKDSSAVHGEGGGGRAGGGGHQVGTGGSSGEGGTGGAGGAGGRSSLPPGYVPVRERGPLRPEELPNERRWFADSRLWELIPPEEMSDDYCYFFRSVSSEQLPFAPLEWRKCGLWCEEADLVQGVSDYVITPGLRTFRIGDSTVAYANVPHGTISVSGRWVRIDRIVNLATGRTEAGLKLEELPGGFGQFRVGNNALREYIDWIRTVEDRSPVFISTAVSWDPEAHLWRQLDWWGVGATAVEGGCQSVVVDVKGRHFIGCNGREIHMEPDPTSREKVVLASVEPDWRVIGGAVEGELFVWLEQSKTGRQQIRAWHPNWGEARKLNIPFPEGTCGIELSPTHLVGYNGACHMPGRGTVWAAKRSGDRIGPEVVKRKEAFDTEGITYSDMNTWGDYIILNVGRLLLVRISDWTVRWIPHLVDGKKIVAWTLTDEHLYAAYGTERYVQFSAEPYLLSVQPIVAFHRYDLSHFEELGEPECGDEGPKCWISWWKPTDP